VGNIYSELLSTIFKMDDTHTRRRLLATASGLTTAAFAGCFGSSDNDETNGGDGSTDGSDGGDGNGGETSSPAWPLFGADRQNTGHNTGTTGPKEGLEVAWTTEIDAGLNGTPVVDDGTLVVSSYDESVYALDADTGDRKWEVDYSSKYTPTIHDGTVYVSSSDKQVVALDADTGEERWVVEEDPRIAPLVVDDSVYVGGYQYGTQDGRDIGTNPIYKYDADTGDREILRDYPFDEEAARYPRAFALAGNSLVFPAKESVRSVDLETGEQEWRFDIDRDDLDMSKGNAVVADGTVYVADVMNLDNPYLYAIDAETGEERWRFYDDEISQIMDDPAVADGVVYFNHDRNTTALDAETGERLWTKKIREELAGGVYGKPTVADDVLYVNGTAFITGVDPATGDVLFDYDYEGNLNTVELVVLEDTIYGLRDSGVVAFEAV